MTHDRHAGVVAQKLTGLEREDFFRGMADTQPFEETGLTPPSACGWIERIFGLTPFDVRSEQRQDAATLPSRMAA